MAVRRTHRRDGTPAAHTPNAAAAASTPAGWVVHGAVQRPAQRQAPGQGGLQVRDGEAEEGTVAGCRLGEAEGGGVEREGGA